jgi:hypothetical protein
MNLQELHEQKRNLDQRFAERVIDDPQKDDMLFFLHKIAKSLADIDDPQKDDMLFFLHKIAKSLADIDFTLSQAFRKEKAFHVRDL